MRILWLTNSPTTSTGYGIQCREISKRMVAAGHAVGVACNFGLSGASLMWQGLPLYPLRQQNQCADVIGTYAAHFGADLVISLYDVWALPKDFRQRLGQVPWAAMVPVDGAPINKQTLKRLVTAEYVISYSEYGDQLLKANGFRPAYCPHGIDTGVFAPGDKTAAREHLGIPDEAYVVTTVAANKGYPPRKAWPQMMEAFVRFKRNHPEALWYCHTTKTPYGSGGEGIYFDRMRDAMGLQPGAMVFPDQGQMAIGVPDDQIALIYQASDVMLLASMGEGFGLPVLEAQACGCPVVTQDCSSMTALTVNGIATKPGHPLWLPQLNYFWQVPDVQRITAALEETYTRDPEIAEEMSEQGVEFVRTRYDHDVVWEQHWLPALREIEKSLW